MTVTVTENQLIRYFFKGSPVFLVVLVVGLFPYVWTVKHDYEAAREVKHTAQVDIFVGLHDWDKRSFEFSDLEEYLREKIPGELIIRIPNPKNEPNRIEVIARLSGDELRSVIESFLKDDWRQTEQLKVQLQNEIRERRRRLDEARDKLAGLESGTAIENAETAEEISAIPRLAEELSKLHERLNKWVHPSEIDPVYEDESGGRVWTVWRTISAIIGGLGVIYFAAICGLAFGYILERRQ